MTMKFYHSGQVNIDPNQYNENGLPVDPSLEGFSRVMGNTA
jgi:hypothetical protein